MKPSIKYSILFLGLIIIIDLISDVILKKQFKQIKFGDYGVINKSLNSDAEILVLGSSRAVHHYNPSIFSEVLNKSCYNAGFGGQGLFLNYALLKESIKKHPPKTVILDLAPNIIDDKKAYTKLNLLLPYYNNHKAFKEIIQFNPEFSKLEIVSSLYVYNSTLYDFSRSMLLKENESNLGFKPLNGQINDSNFNPFFLENEEIDPNKIIYLNKIINVCKINNIKLIGVVSPTYLKFDKRNLIINKLKKVFINNDLEFYDYSNHSKFYQKKYYFKDQLHLNGIGADNFSKDLIKKIKL